MSTRSSIARSTSRTRRHALATIEFAFVLPLLLLILAGVVDFGRVGYERCILASAAEHAAAVASHNAPAKNEDPSQWLAKVQATVEQDLSQLTGFSPDALQVDTVLVEQGGVDCVEVEIRYPFHTWFAWPGLDSLVLFEVAVRPVDF